MPRAEAPVPALEEGLLGGPAHGDDMLAPVHTSAGAAGGAGGAGDDAGDNASGDTQDHPGLPLVVAHAGGCPGGMRMAAGGIRASTYTASVASHVDGDDEEDGDLFPEYKPMMKGALFVTLCLVDLSHVFLTMLNMWFLAFRDGDAKDLEFANLKENALWCFWLYVAKIVTHGGMVILRMLCNSHAKPNDPTGRWRESQEWFVAMTFNSFMMLFPVFFIATDGLANPWRLVKRSKWKRCVMREDYRPPDGVLRPSASGLEASLLNHSTAAAIGKDETVYISYGHYDKLIEQHRQEQEQEQQSDVLDLSQPRSPRSPRETVTITGYVLTKNPHRPRVPKIKQNGRIPTRGWTRVQHIPANAVEVTEDCVWQWASHGWVDVFARLGKGGPWDLAASYAMLLNIICTFYAGLVNIKAITSADQNDLLSIASLACIVAHFLVALWLYMGSKLYLTQKMDGGKTFALVLIAMVDSAAVSMGLLLAHSLSSPTLQTLWHRPIQYGDGSSMIPSNLKLVASVWFWLMWTMLAIQFLAALYRGYQSRWAQDEARKQGRRETTNPAFMAKSDQLQATTFNTWLMPLVLVCLEMPYRANLLTRTHDAAPFRRLGQHPVLLRLGVVLFTLCRVACTWLCIYVSIAYAAAPWGSLTRGRASEAVGICDAFPCDPTSVYAAVALFALQGSISFFFSFLWTWHPREIAAHLGMLMFCVLDMVNITTSGYYAACLAIGNSTSSPENNVAGIFECERDFFDDEGHVLHGISDVPVFRLLAKVLLCIYVSRFVVQACAFAVRRGQANDIVDRVPVQSALINGIVHGSFVLCALWPMDLPLLLQNRWSPLQTQPHWTNGIVQLINLVEKTIAGYLMLQLRASNEAGTEAQPLAVMLVTIFVSHSAVQVMAFIYQHLVRPGRAEELEIGDHVREDEAICSPCGYCSKKILEVKDIITVERAREILDNFEEKSRELGLQLAAARRDVEREKVDDLMRENNRLEEDRRLAAKLIPDSTESEPDPNLCVYRLERYVVHERDRRAHEVSLFLPSTQGGQETTHAQPSPIHRHSSVVVVPTAVISYADGTKPPDNTLPLGSSSHGVNVMQLTRVNSYAWSVTVLSLAFLDWFHVVFNLVNLSFMAGQFVEFPDDVLTETQGLRNRVLCFICIGIYLIRVLVQPAMLMWEARSALCTDATLSAIWHQNLRWYTSMVFNTLLMLPAMMFVSRPFCDSAKTVREAYVKLGAQGAKDYQAGFILFLMVVKKSINGYLIVSWIIANEATKQLHIDDHTEQTEYAQFISMGLLVLHFIVTLYVMMVPKLAHSQNGSVSKGCFLLTVALVDWLALLTNGLSLIDVFQHEHAADPGDSCHWKAQNLYGVSIAATVLFFLRVCSQIVAYVHLRSQRGPLNRRHLGFRYSHDMGPEADKWRKWSNEFQALTFNSWMMVPALLFIEKPYRSNLLKAGDESPFRRPAEFSGGLVWVGIIYFIMTFKKLCLIYVNFFKLKDDCGFADGGTASSYGNTVSTTALALTLLHSLLWFYTFRSMGVCEFGDEDEVDDEQGEDVGHDPSDVEAAEPGAEALTDVPEGSLEETSSSSGAGRSTLGARSAHTGRDTNASLEPVPADRRSGTQPR
jgi:hypothetical protein